MRCGVIEEDTQLPCTLHSAFPHHPCGHESIALLTQCTLNHERFIIRVRRRSESNNSLQSHTFSTHAFVLDRLKPFRQSIRGQYQAFAFVNHQFVRNFSASTTYEMMAFIPGNLIYSTPPHLPPRLSSPPSASRKPNIHDWNRNLASNSRLVA